MDAAAMVALAKMGAAFAASIVMIGAAALIEGLAFFAIIAAVLVLFLVG